jgi:hypothetical protein
LFLESGIGDFFPAAQKPFFLAAFFSAKMVLAYGPKKDFASFSDFESVSD